MSNDEKLEQAASKLRFQVLNNLDELTNPNGKGAVKVDLELLDRLVKRPIMQAVTMIENAKSDSNGPKGSHN